jgi:hypothetical protein
LIRGEQTVIFRNKQKQEFFTSKKLCASKKQNLTTHIVLYQDFWIQTVFSNQIPTPMNITFDELRRLKHSLPTGSVSRIAQELSKDEQEIRNFFGASLYKGSTTDWHYEPGPNGGIVNVHDTSILDAARRILHETERS